MEIKRFEKIINNINEYLSSTWILLSDTTIYIINNIKLIKKNEPDLNELKKRRETDSSNMDSMLKVREETAKILKELRLQGFNPNFNPCI